MGFLDLLSSIEFNSHSICERSFRLHLIVKRDFVPAGHYPVGRGVDQNKKSARGGSHARRKQFESRILGRVWREKSCIGAVPSSAEPAEAHFTLTLTLIFAPPMRQILNPNALSDAVDGKLGAEICEGFKRLYKLKDLIEIKIA